MDTPALIGQDQNAQVTFLIPGKPQQRGSKNPFVVRNKRGQMLNRTGGIVKTAFDTPVITVPDSNKKSKAHMRLITRMIKERKGELCFTGPVILQAHFYFQRPKCHYGTGRNSTKLKDKAPQRFHAQKPDASKLIRCLEDAITDSGLWKDDAQVVGYGSTSKLWTRNSPHTEIEIFPLSPEDKAQIIEQKPPF